jgi:hypothetical protein
VSADVSIRQHKSAYVSIRQASLRKEEQKEEADFFRVWREPIEVLEKA